MELITHCNRTSKKWITIAEQAYKVSLLRKQCELKEKELYEELKKLSKQESSLGGGYMFSKIERKGNIDYSSIPALKKIDLEKYRKDPVIMWKLEYTGIK